MGIYKFLGIVERRKLKSVALTDLLLLVFKYNRKTFLFRIKAIFESKEIPRLVLRL